MYCVSPTIASGRRWLRRAIPWRFGEGTLDPGTIPLGPPKAHLLSIDPFNNQRMEEHHERRRLQAPEGARCHRGVTHCDHGREVGVPRWRFLPGRGGSPPQRMPTAFIIRPKRVFDGPAESGRRHGGQSRAALLPQGLARLQSLRLSGGGPVGGGGDLEALSRRGDGLPRNANGPCRWQSA